MDSVQLPSSVAKNREFIFFTDFDGTITIDDTTVFLIDNYGMGRERRMKLDQDVLDGRIHFRNAFREMMDSVALPFETCIEVLIQNIQIDPGFQDFYAWARESGVPIVVLSSGVEPIIRALLNKLLGSKWDIQIVANTIEPRDGESTQHKNGWKMQFRDESVHGHDKSLAIRKYSSLQDSLISFYAGDGISDLSAARETDLLFAKTGKSASMMCPIPFVTDINNQHADLVHYCQKENVPFVPFSNWSNITKICKDIVAGKTSIQEVLQSPV
ncbi:prolyl aminopeptidase (secreted protein) [Purpureocillium lavendulum]|uniref:Prolyl aminopeptidase (Secreted protein) n=1 Tax=Purpureocillium lavendulum TaxID=1247861 RepID=A0AB34FDH1_9HYPO|nr:prolyl aminopeptidase (secreted protein) [Purpureocillium lavendulum]